MVDDSICDLFSFGTIVGFSYINVSTRMCAITCISRKHHCMA